ncbi:MAG: hypothetical protein JSW73_05650 [Candidatus Woesearchaeota archaeon]|nr:MAG: hypothetical protein JSW73_05650 [Candidatus Woesearchaeota archaeon]
MMETNGSNLPAADPSPYLIQLDKLLDSSGNDELILYNIQQFAKDFYAGVKVPRTISPMEGLALLVDMYSRIPEIEPVKDIRGVVNFVLACLHDVTNDDVLGMPVTIFRKEDDEHPYELGWLVNRQEEGRVDLFLPDNYSILDIYKKDNLGSKHLMLDAKALKKVGPYGKVKFSERRERPPESIMFRGFAIANEDIGKTLDQFYKVDKN